MKDRAHSTMILLINHIRASVALVFNEIGGFRSCFEKCITIAIHNEPVARTVWLAQKSYHVLRLPG